MFKSQFRSLLREQSTTSSVYRSQAHPCAPLQEAVPPGLRWHLKSQNKQRAHSAQEQTDLGS